MAPHQPVQYEQIGELMVHPDYRTMLTDNGLCEMDRLLETPGETRLDKRGLAAWRQRVVLTLSESGEPQKCYLKRFAHPPWRQQLMTRLAGFGSTAEVEFHWIRQLERLGIGTLKVVACGSRRNGVREVASLLLTAEISGDSLERWLPLRAALLNRTMKQRVAQHLAALVAKMHNAGLVHRDLYMSHIFITAKPENDFDLSVLDLQRVFRPRLRRWRWIVKDLAALNYSTPLSVATSADRVRWLKLYLEKRSASANSKALIRAVARKTSRIAQHSAKHGLG
jgi:heptose I phosphotransferase